MKLLISSWAFSEHRTLKDMAMIPVMSMLFPKQVFRRQDNAQRHFPPFSLKKKYYVIVLACAESVNRQPD